MPTRTKSLSGVWVHPADGDDYPNELTMKVTESTGAFGIISWQTITTGHPEPFKDTVWSYTYGEGAATALFAVQRADGTWSSPHPMDEGRWYVPGRTIAAARERMREFFTEAGYNKKEKS